MPHTPDDHILDSIFAEKERGLKTPKRRLGCLLAEFSPVAPSGRDAPTRNSLLWVPFGLCIANLDRSVPPGYVDGGYVRTAAFNRNVFSLTSAPSMPPIDVTCGLRGIDPKVSPLFWRLQCRTVICRHTNTDQYRYRGACEILDMEWQGRSFTPSFRLFDEEPSATLAYDYNGPTHFVMGGNALLSVAVRIPDESNHLIDYVHLRIKGTNPTKQDVHAWLDERLAGRHPNVGHMIKAVLDHEAHYAQFSAGPQTGSRMTFRPKHHQNETGQPDCEVRFGWPPDPPGFPFATFDFGVGISQWTHVHGQRVGPRRAWDWRENVQGGAEKLLASLRAKYAQSASWDQWARQAWRAYNGGGPQADDYAAARATEPEGREITNVPLPPRAEALADVAPLAAVPDLPSPPRWPPASAGFITSEAVHE